ncbi:MAG: hypothetical protein ACK4L4_19100 [Gemmobacter sp.]
MTAPIATLSVPVWPIAGRPPLGTPLAEWAGGRGAGEAVTITVTAAEIHIRFDRSGATFGVDLQAIGQEAYEAVVASRRAARTAHGGRS